MTDPRQFEAFVQAYQNMVYTTALRLLGRESDAEDVAQETFLRAYHHFTELADRPSAGGWLKTVTRNLCLNHLARYRNRWRFFSELNPNDNPDDHQFEWAAPDLHQEQMTANDRRRILESALRRLPDSQRVPLVLFHFEDMPYDQIASRLGVSLAKIKTDIHRGREALRHHLTQTLPAEVLQELGGEPKPCLS